MTGNSFYFVRHGQTDHNVNKVYDDLTDVPLNQIGVQQAIDLKEKLQKLKIVTVISSPLLRVQQTKNFLFQGLSFEDIIFEEFKECPSKMWRLFLAWEERLLSHEEWAQIDHFIHQVKLGLMKAETKEKPLLIIAHGGTFWALSHLLQLKVARKIDNCIPVRFYLNSHSKWELEFV